jgi:hypothetical protein
MNLWKEAEPKGMLIQCIEEEKATDIDYER